MIPAALAGLVLARATAEPAVPPPPIPERWELEWVAPSGCPDEAAIHAQIAALVPAPGLGEGVLHVAATVVPRDEAFVLALRTEFAGRRDEREVRAQRCGELAEAVALVVAISLDPSLAISHASALSPRPAEPEPPEAEPREAEPRASRVAPQSEPGASSEATRPAAREDAPSRGSRPSTAPTAWILRLAPKLEVGTLPAFGGGLELAAGLLWRRWRLELHGAHSWPRRALGPVPSGGRFQLGAVGVRGCGRPRAGPVELPMCLGLDGGALRADSEGLRPAVTVHGPWLASSLGVGLAVGAPRVAFWTLVEGSATLVWSRILVGETTLFRPFPVSARGLVGLEIRFAIESR